MLLSLLIACAPVMRFPGPLSGMGFDPEIQDSAQNTPTQGPPPSARAIVSAAKNFVGDSKLSVAGTAYRYDCSGLVEAALASAHCPFKGSSAMLWEEAVRLGIAHHRRVPTPGDVAFFDDTYDRDGNGRLGDALTHVAVVESVDGAGTVTLVHVGSAGVVRFQMNLRHPGDRDDAHGTRRNDYLRQQSAGDSGATRYLSGELWHGFASFYKVQAQIADRS